MLSKDKHERLKQAIKLLSALSEETPTKALLKELGDFQQYAVLKYCEQHELIVRRRSKRTIYNALTGKGKRLLKKYGELLDYVS